MVLSSQRSVIKMCLPPPFISHTRRVCSLYKRALRNLEAWYDRRHIYRYHAILLRQRFEQNRCVKDALVAEEKVCLGEQELFLKRHWQPRKFTYSPGGAAFEREVVPPDWVLDHWHPLEKAQYPEYFAQREQRKCEYLEAWEKKYGKDSCQDEQ